VLAGFHLVIGMRRTDGTEPADPQQSPGDNITFPAGEPVVNKARSGPLGELT
jgi:hypothetical protein